MDFLIADTFTDSLARLTGEEQKAVKTTAFDLQLNPANPGMAFHKLDRARDKNFWSVRVNSDIRVIVHRTDASLLICYVGHHDKAYEWAERRKLETHPMTGAAQLVEIRERVEEIAVPRYITVEQPAARKRLLFEQIPDDQLLRCGVPPDWLADVRDADEDSILEIAGHLPGEAAEALLDLAIGRIPRVADNAVTRGDPFQHPDALRRFRVMNNMAELAQALEFPWEKWTVFLHPAQRELVERNYNGPVRVSGSAGTGKTIVALHRAVFLARVYPGARILLTTFSETLASSLRTKLKRLIGNEPRLAERLEIHAIDLIGQRLYELHFGKSNLASRAVILESIEESVSGAETQKFSSQFLLSEWEQVVDAWQLDSWEAYRDVKRLGRKTRLSEVQRRILWSIFEQVQAGLQARRLITRAGMFTRLSARLTEGGKPPFDFTIVDEAQGIEVAQLRFLAAMGANRPDGLFFTGDLGQRIFQQSFSWKAVGVDIRGRSRTLKVNYRTSHQIRMQADRLLEAELSDVDGNAEERRGTISVFNGPPPMVQTLDSPEYEIRAVAEWLTKLSADGIKPHEIGIFVRSLNELDRARCAVEQAKIPFKILDEHVETTTGFVSIATMHLAKGLEFRAIAVMACDDEILPLQERIETVSDDSDLQEVYDTERHLLYVACTRARDHLLVTSGDAPSEFLMDLCPTL